MSITNLDAHRILQGFSDGKFTAREVTQAFLDRIESINGKLFAFTSVDTEGALAKADDVDRRRAAGQVLGPLAGVPVAVKDNICTRGWPTTCSSKILENWRPPYDACVIEKLNAADAVILGKTNLDEFAMGSSTENSGLGTTANPWKTDCVPGGSSGGSAVAVAARMAPLALGSDTGGSIRQPASLCGVAGMKPTYGLVSRYGLVAFGSSLDQIGPLARTAHDLALLSNVIFGYDRRDSTSLDRDYPDQLSELKDNISGLRIGIPKEFFGEGTAPEVDATVREAIETLEAAGAVVTEISLPNTKYSIAAYYIVATAEASSNLARYDGVHYGHRTAQQGTLIDLYSRSRAEGFGDEVKRRIMLGNYVLSAGYYDAYYKKALAVRELISRDFQKAFESVDVIAGPTSPTTAWPIGAKVDDPLAMYLSDIDTLGLNLAGLPGVSIPCGFDAEALPIGLQLIGNYFTESTLLSTQAAFQSKTDFHEKEPAC